MAKESKAAKPKVNGKPLPRGLEQVIPSRFTDEGIERRNRETKAEPGRVAVQDRHERAVEAYDAAQAGSIQPWEGQNPLTEAAARVQQPGMKVRFLSPRVIEKRGMRGFVIAHDSEGREVKVGRMIAAHMPEELAQKKREHYQREGNDALADAQENYQALQEKAIRDGRGVGLAPLRAGEIVRDSRDRTRVATTGLRSQRGNSAVVEEG
jgi:hypothetical protein